MGKMDKVQSMDHFLKDVFGQRLGHHILPEIYNHLPLTFQLFSNKYYYKVFRPVIKSY